VRGSDSTDWVARRNQHNQSVRLYLDSSTLVKLVQREVESEALRRFLHLHPGDERVISTLARVEVVRSVLSGGSAAVMHARRQLARVYQVVMDMDVLDLAATLAPGLRIRTLDAIHLATAQLLGADLRAVVTYDERMAAAASTLGLGVVAPS
jgi:predicted nucleic acid-binding protein